MQTIYKPNGRAKEYALLALELYRCDSHPRGGCVHGCSYCYVPGCLRLSGAQFRTGVRPREDIIGALSHDAPRFTGTDKRVLLSFFSDPYQPGVVNITRHALAILHGLQIPFMVLTKCGTPYVQDDFDLYGSDDAFGVTLTTLDNRGAAVTEPLAGSPLRRINNLGVAKSKGIHTYVSLEPVLDPAATLRIIEETHDLVDHYNVGKLNHNPGAERAIDWRLFGVQAIKRLECFGKTYTIKDDLRRFLDGIPYTQTEHRTVDVRGVRVHRAAIRKPGPGAPRPA